MTGQYVRPALIFAAFLAFLIAGCYGAAIAPLATMGVAQVAGFSAGKMASRAAMSGNGAGGSAPTPVPAVSSAMPLGTREVGGAVIQVHGLALPTRQMPALEVRFSIKNANGGELVVERIEGIDARGIFVEQMDENEFTRLLYEGMQGSMVASSNSMNSTDAYAKTTGMAVASTLLGAFVPGLTSGLMMGYLSGEEEKQSQGLRKAQGEMRAALEGFKQRRAKTIELAPGGTCIASAFFSSHVTLSAVAFTLGGKERTRLKIPLG